MQMLFENTCVICRADKLIFRKKKAVLGITVCAENYLCENCGSLFLEDELRWKLIGSKDKLNPLWQQFHQKSFYVREWLSMGELRKQRE